VVWEVSGFPLFSANALSSTAQERGGPSLVS
jgi:hypothetical protein